MLLSTVLPLLPPPLLQEIRALFPSAAKARAVSEIRMRVGRRASLSLFHEGRLSNLPLGYIADGDAVRKTLSAAAGGSTYAYEKELSFGFLPLSNGIRMGVAGDVTQKSDGSLCLTEIRSLVFRLPQGEPSACPLYAFYKRAKGGILLFAPPGGGKTSLLRAFVGLAAKEERVALIDTREEFSFSSPALLLDHLTGYPKAEGAELAVRTLSPELLVLDELGAKEASALASLVSFGVRTVATAHAEECGELLSSKPLSSLFSAGIFTHLWDVRAARAYPVRQGDGI